MARKRDVPQAAGRNRAVAGRIYRLESNQSPSSGQFPHATLPRCVFPCAPAAILTDSDSRWRAARLHHQSTPRQYFPNENPLGHQLSILWDGREPGVIVGPVGDVRYTDINNDVMPTVYWPEWQRVFSDMNVLSKTSAPPIALSNAAARAIRRLDPSCRSIMSNP
jgi:hypothetical protein